jgi:GNAT superfamily N-acetyltransferase
LEFDLDFKKIEYAGFRSWPAADQKELNGVVLRSSNGFTKRANSANMLEFQSEHHNELVNNCEQYFFDKSLPCIFRIPSFVDNASLDTYLEQSGYQSIDRSLVLYRELSPSSFHYVKLIEKNPEEWIDSYSQISGIDAATQKLHLEMLNRISDKTLMAVLIEDDIEIACGLGVLSDNLFGLFDVGTLKPYRNQGYAAKLLNGMLSWAVSHGATQSYLQVVANNAPAISLYRKLGYQDCYEYWYRIKQYENARGAM